MPCDDCGFDRSDQRCCRFAGRRRMHPHPEAEVRRVSALVRRFGVQDAAARVRDLDVVPEWLRDDYLDAWYGEDHRQEAVRLMGPGGGWPGKDLPF